MSSSYQAPFGYSDKSKQKQEKVNARSSIPAHQYGVESGSKSLLGANTIRYDEPNAEPQQPQPQEPYTENKFSPGYYICNHGRIDKNPSNITRYPERDCNMSPKMGGSKRRRLSKRRSNKKKSIRRKRR